MYPRDNASFTVSAAPELMLADNIYIYICIIMMIIIIFIPYCMLLLCYTFIYDII